MLSVKQQYRNLTASAHGEEAQTTFEDTGSMNVLRIQKTDSITRAACGPPGNLPDQKGRGGNESLSPEILSEIVPEKNVLFVLRENESVVGVFLFLLQAAKISGLKRYGKHPVIINNDQRHLISSL